MANKVTTIQSQPPFFLRFNSMWTVSYIWNDKPTYEVFTSYERALARYAVLFSSGRSPSIHHNHMKERDEKPSELHR